MTDARSIPIAMTITAANIDERISIYDLLHNVDGLLMVEDKLSNLWRVDPSKQYI